MVIISIRPSERVLRNKAICFLCCIEMYTLLSLKVSNQQSHGIGQDCMCEYGVIVDGRSEGVQLFFHKIFWIFGSEGEIHCRMIVRDEGEGKEFWREPPIKPPPYRPKMINFGTQSCKGEKRCWECL